MLAMARGLATDPALLILDELSMGLAPLVVEELYELVAQVAAEGVSILVVEQFASTVLGVADHVALMVNGRIVRVGSARRGGRQPVGGLPRRMTAPRTDAGSVTGRFVEEWVPPTRWNPRGDP